MRRLAVIFALGLGGCRALIGIDDPVVVGDAAVDVPGDDAADASTCYGVAPFRLCTTAPPRTTFDAASVPVDLDTSTTCDDIVRGWCVIVAKDVTISGQLRVTGARPLALLALGTMNISGAVLADANGAVAGPGADASQCNTGVAASSGDLGGGGGAGGSFATKGGNGGTGNNTNNAGALAPGIILVIDDLRGGCRGSAGANGGTGGTANPAGGGGGGVYLLAAGSMSLNGKVDASGGGGGRGNQPKSGGSGGGSGGMIVLWSPMLTGKPMLLASGGGGGGGADQGANGIAGFEPSSTSAANGGLGGSPGAGVGGKGSSGTIGGQDGADDTTQAGGGGGGGGGGVIRIFGGNMFTNMQASPPPS